MACIKSAQRAALTALAPDAPYLAAGTMNGAVDMLFSTSANIDIFRLDFQSDSTDLPLITSAPSPDRFNRLSWSKPAASGGEDSFSLGLLAGGLGDGSIAVWNPLSMIRSEGQGDDAIVARLEKHTGPVRGLEFSELSPNLLASGADEGEICIWDLKNPSEPVVFPPLKSVGSSAPTEISYVSWNPKFQHILASTSSNEMTVVWDLRSQKPLTSFSDSNRRKCSVLQWNPDMSTHLIVASDDDDSPSLRVWDVRKTISPVREFVGHSKGVIAMSWCPYDSSFLLTCSKDNRTICWDTVSGEIVTELPASANGNFDIHWYRKIPGVISASSYDVKIGIYNLEFSGRYAAGEGAVGAPARSRAPAPKWLKCPMGASFGFGGKLVSFHPAAPMQGGQVTISEVHVHNLVMEQNLVSRSTEFEAAIQNGEKSSLRALCDKKSQESLSEEDKETWGFLRVMFEDEGTARTNLLGHLGFNVPPEVTENSTDELSKTLADSLNLDNALTDNTDAQFLVDNGEDFFNNPQPCETSLPKESFPTDGQQVDQAAAEQVVTSNPSIDKSIQHALVVGDYKGAVSQCLAANRMADALVIAHAGSSALWENTRNHYLKNSISPYLKVVSAMVGNDLMGFVSTWPLDAWKETLALLCTFSQKEEWPVLCDTLASRLLNVGDTLAATLCYICAGNIDKTVEIWSRNLKPEDGGKTYVDLLQDLMEKTITLALATGHKRFSASLSKLVENYAELLASQGLLKTAVEYLKLLGSDEHSLELAILRERIAFSTEENDATRSLVPESSGNSSPYLTNQPSYSALDPSQNVYQVPQPYNVPNNTYADAYQQQPNSAYGGYGNTYQPQPTQFVPTSTLAGSQLNSVPAPVPQQTVKTFTPTSLPGLKNPEQYKQPNTLGSQLYAGAVNPPYPSGPSAPYQTGPPTQFQPGQSAPYHQFRSPVQYQAGQPAPSHGAGASPSGTTPSQKFPHGGPTNPTPRFMPSNNQGLNPGQPSSPTQAQAKLVAPPAPPPTVQTVDTSNVPAELRPVIATLTRLFDETHRALGGPQANPAKKREIEDNSRKIGALFVKLNTGDISPNVSSKLIQLCTALDRSDFAAAMHLQVLLTTSDWDECNFWLAALKRMIKTRQNFRM